MIQFKTTVYFIFINRHHALLWMSLVSVGTTFLASLLLPPRNMSDKQCTMRGDRDGMRHTHNIDTATKHYYNNDKKIKLNNILTKNLVIL